MMRRKVKKKPAAPEYGPRAAIAADLGLRACRYCPAYSSACGVETINESGICPGHTGIKCGVCGEQSTHQCSYAGQFVCGFELCDYCVGFEDTTKASGAWGFLNHSHRALDRPRVAVCGDLGWFKECAHAG